MFDLLDRLKRWFIDLVKSRVFVLMLVFIVLSTILIQRVFVLQIVNGQAYLDDYKLQIQKTKEVQGTRGRILDRNGVVLADNKLAYSVTIEDNGDYDTVKEKNKIINATIEKVISIVESNGDSIVNDFKIILNDNGEYAYSMTSEVQRLRFLADVFGKATIDKLSNKQKAYSAADLMHYLCTDETYGYGLDEQKLSKEEILKELEWLKGRYHKAVVQGRNRTCFSLVLETEPFYVAAVRDAYGRDLDEIITDVPEIREVIQGYLEEISPELKEKLRFYQDKLLPLYKLYRVETALDTIQKEKVWLNSGGFLVIQQTEAFVSIDVNSGKYTGKKKMEETFRKINLEAAAEISRQLRLRNLSGIILIDFINMENPDHRDELFHVLQKLLRKDPIKSRAIDITPLHILEMTRKKVRRPVNEDIREIAKK